MKCGRQIISSLIVVRTCWTCSTSCATCISWQTISPNVLKLLAVAANARCEQLPLQANGNKVWPQNRTQFKARQLKVLVVEEEEEVESIEETTTRCRLWTVQCEPHFSYSSACSYIYTPVQHDHVQIPLELLHVNCLLRCVLPFDAMQSQHNALPQLATAQVCLPVTWRKQMTQLLIVC